MGVRARVSLVLAVSVAAGCSHQRHLTAGAGLAATVGGVLVLRHDNSQPADEHESSLDQPALGGILLIGGLITLFAAAALDEKQAEEQPIVIRVADRRNDLDRQDAWSLTKVARDAARQNDCAAVADLSVRTQRVDADLHATVFMRDAAIQRCLLARPMPPASVPPASVPPASVSPGIAPATELPATAPDATLPH